MKQENAVISLLWFTLQIRVGCKKERQPETGEKTDSYLLQTGVVNK